MIKTTIFRKLFSHIIILSVFIFPLFLSAQSGIPGGGPTVIDVKINNPFNCGNNPNCTIMDLIVAILENIIMPIAAVAVTMWIIWAGFGFLMAQGKPAEIDKAKQRLLWALIGAGILLGAVGISKVVQNTVRVLVAP
ncbi:MAG: Uncharacterized protein CEO12_657 [Parcubacteria group bacterium Gr01-1014_46]|nr:MAG: Uncharacterized protein CEO12_657 [Parcubacteria group bacterium Gr01-1014_46]